MGCVEICIIAKARFFFLYGPHALQLTMPNEQKEWQICDALHLKLIFHRALICSTLGNVLLRTGTTNKVDCSFAIGSMKNPEHLSLLQCMAGVRKVRANNVDIL